MLWTRLGSVLSLGWFLFALEKEWGGLWPRVFLLSVTLLLFGIGALLTRRKRLPFFGATFLVFLVALAARIKVRMLERPLLWDDLKFISSGDLMETLGHYLSAVHLILIILGLTGLAFLAWRLHTTERPSRKVRVAAIAVLLVSASVIAWTKDFEAIRKLSPKSLQRHPFSTFVVSLKGFRLELRPVASPEKSTAIEIAVGPHRPGLPAKALPDLVGILEESTFNPTATHPVTLNSLATQFFNPENGIWGSLRVPVFGGGTWLSAFTFLTGISGRALGDMAFYVPILLERKVHDSIPTLLKKLGYRTVVIFPVERNFVNEENFDRSLGFDEFYDPKDLGWNSNNLWKTPDRVLLQEVINRVRRRNQSKDSQPLFIWTYTMINHGPHGTPGCTGCGFQDYWKRFHDTPGDMETFLREMDRIEGSRPYSVVHFGDHLPAFLEEELSGPGTDDTESRYVTYYAIPRTAKSGARLKILDSRQQHRGPLDLAFLGGLWLQENGIPLDDLWMERNRIAEDCDGKYLHPGRSDCRERMAILHRRLLDEGRIEIPGQTGKPLPEY